MEQTGSNTGIAKGFFSKLGWRNARTVKNISQGFIAKGLSIAVNFLQIPIVLTLLNKTEYGLWITIFSVTSWLGFFDIGVGNGLRNKLTEALAVNDIKKAKSMVSTAYISITLIFTAIIAAFIPLSFVIPWAKIFKPSLQAAPELYLIIFICVVSTALNFIFSVIYTVLAAHHQTGKSSLLLLTSQAVILGILFYIKYSGMHPSLLYIITLLSVTPLLFNIVFNIYFFSTRYADIRPSFDSYEKSHLKEIMNLGGMFFVIQIAVLVMYATDNLIITQLFGPESVTMYSLVYRYFSIINFVFAIVNAPLWTMYVDAYSKGELNWISRSIKKLLKLFYVFVLAVIIMLLCSKVFFHLWISKSFDAPLLLESLVGFYVLSLVWGNIWVIPLNASGKIKLQMFVSISVAIVNIPLIYFIHLFVKNVSAVVLGNIICVLIGNAFMYFYFKKIFSRAVNSQNPEQSGEISLIS